MRHYAVSRPGYGVAEHIVAEVVQHLLRWITSPTSPTAPAASSRRPRTGGECSPIGTPATMRPSTSARTPTANGRGGEPRVPFSKALLPGLEPAPSARRQPAPILAHPLRHEGAPRCPT